MAKRLAISTQLKSANTRIADLEKKLKDAEATKDRWYQEAQKHEQMLE